MATAHTSAERLNRLSRDLTEEEIVRLRTCAQGPKRTYAVSWAPDPLYDDQRYRR
jgi:hypothetical protein